MKDKIIVSDYFHEEEAKQNLKSSSFSQDSNKNSQPEFTSSIQNSNTCLEEPFTTSQRLSHSFRDSNQYFGYMPLNSTSDVGFNQYPIYSNNLIFNLDSDSYSSDDPLLFNSQHLIIPDEQLKDSSNFQTNPNMERLDSCVSEISTSSSERTIERSPLEVQIPRQSLFEMAYSSFSSDTELTPVSERSSPKLMNPMMTKNVRMNHLPSLETLRKQVSCELNIHNRKVDQMMKEDIPSLNIIMAGCSSSGKSQLKSLLSSVMEFESERILPDSESYPKLVFRPVYRNLDHGTRSYKVTQDESQISFYKWDENLSRCSVMFQPMDSDTSEEVISQRIMFTDMPGIESPEQCPNYCKLLSQLYVGMYMSEMNDKMIEYGFENIKAGGRIQQFMCHDLVILTIPMEFNENELKITKSLRQHLDCAGIPYLVVATKTDLVDNNKKVLEKKRELAKLLSIRSFDILTIGMSGKSKEGIEDFELIRNELHKESMLILRQALLQFNKKRDFMDAYKMSHGGLTCCEHFIKELTMNLFHYWMILHKVIHWIVIGPGECEEAKQDDHEDESEIIPRPVEETKPKVEDVPKTNSMTCNQVILSPLPHLPPPPMKQFPSIPPLRTTGGPSNISTHFPPKQQVDIKPSIIREELPIEQKLVEKPRSEVAEKAPIYYSSSSSDSSECDDDEVLCEEECIYYTKPLKENPKKKQKSIPYHEVVEDLNPSSTNMNDEAPTMNQDSEERMNEEEDDSEESTTSYYLCSMRIFQCLVISLLFVLVFQSFALFALQHLSSI